MQRTCSSAENQKLNMWFSASQTGRYFRFLHSNLCIQVQNASTSNARPGGPGALLRQLAWTIRSAKIRRIARPSFRSMVLVRGPAAIDRWPSRPIGVAPPARRGPLGAHLRWKRDAAGAAGCAESVEEASSRVERPRRALRSWPDDPCFGCATLGGRMLARSPAFEDAQSAPSVPDPARSRARLEAPVGRSRVDRL